MHNLDGKEKSMLLAILDQYLESLDETKEAMIEDRATLNTLDRFTTTLQQHDIDKETVESIRRKVLDDD